MSGLCLLPRTPERLSRVFGSSPNNSSRSSRDLSGSDTAGLLALLLGAALLATMVSCSLSVEKVILYNTEFPATKATPITKVGPT